MRNSFKLIFYIFLIMGYSHAGAQKFNVALNELVAKTHPEKIYIQYDKDYYVAGETIWFKAYLYSNGKPGSENNNLFLQFLNDKGQLVTSRQLPVEAATAKGSIELPDSLPGGNYYVRALVPSMLNGDETFIYKKDIVVFKHSTNANKPLPAQDISVQFFPESGNLVDGIITVVGFKAVDQFGNPVEVSGMIVADDGANVTPFKSYHDGIGRLQFKVQDGKKYRAEIEAGSVKKTVPLAEVNPAGINLKMQDEKGGKRFQLTRGKKEKEKFETVTLVAQINNHVVYENEVSFEDYPSITGHLLTDSLPSGILHFTVFNKDGMPLAERLSFIDNKEYVSKAAIHAVTVSSVKRAANTLELNFDDTLQRRCSVAITDAAITSNDRENIWSNFLLTSDLKGHVYNPAWYFESAKDSATLGLDNLLLTHGWSRFNWIKILANQFSQQQYTDEAFIAIKGNVVDDKLQLPVANGKLEINIEPEDSVSKHYIVKVDVKGNFDIDSLVFNGKTKIYYAYTDNKGKEKPVLVNLAVNPLQKAMENLPENVLQNTIANHSLPYIKADIDSRYEEVGLPKNVKVLEKVTIQTAGKRPEEIVNEKYTTGVFTQPGKITLDNINNPVKDKSMTALNYIKNRIRQLDIQNNTFVNRKNMSLGSGQNWLVGILVNEVPANIDQLNILKADDVALVKFYEAGFVGVGSGFPGGAVAVYTKDKGDNDQKYDDLKYVNYNGYAISKEFYQPDYADKTRPQPVSDHRSTLYWNADVFTGAANKSFKLNFFNNDYSKKFKVVVEGFDASGKLLHIEKIVGE